MLTKLSAQGAEIILANGLRPEARINPDAEDTEIGDGQAGDLPIEAPITKHFLESVVLKHAHLPGEALADQVAINQERPVS